MARVLASCDLVRLCRWPAVRLWVERPYIHRVRTAIQPRCIRTTKYASGRRVGQSGNVARSHEGPCGYSTVSHSHSESCMMTVFAVCKIHDCTVSGTVLLQFVCRSKYWNASQRHRDYLSINTKYSVRCIWLPKRSLDSRVSVAVENTDLPLSQ
jgi:hypothetical protein